MRFIDLYAGIGGIRLGFQRVFKDAEFVFSSEINASACKTYESNFSINPQNDITKTDAKDISDFDILLAGIPCQAFSMAGYKLGFDDIRGTHFFEVSRIIKKKMPKAFLIENVRNLISHDNGKTFKTMKKVIEEDLGYTLYYEVLDAQDFGLPQKRKRVFIVGFRDKIQFEFPKPTKKKSTIRDILETDPVDESYFISKKYHNGLKIHRKRHELKGNGFGYIVHSHDDIANTLVLGGMGKERNLIVDKKSFVHRKRKDANVRALRTFTPREYLRLQGFPNSFKITVPKTQMWRQAANSVPIPVVTAVAKSMKKALNEHKPVTKSEKQSIIILFKEWQFLSLCMSSVPII